MITELNKRDGLEEPVNIYKNRKECLDLTKARNPSTSLLMYSHTYHENPKKTQTRKQTKNSRLSKTLEGQSRMGDRTV
jgi:hypothetical protein